MSANRYHLIGGSNGQPARQVLRDQLGRVIQPGDSLVMNTQEIPTYWVIGVRSAQDPRLPAGTLLLELGARVQLMFPPSPTGSTTISGVVVERLPEDQGERRGQALEEELERQGVEGRELKGAGRQVISLAGDGGSE